VPVVNRPPKARSKTAAPRQNPVAQQPAAGAYPSRQMSPAWKIYLSLQGQRRANHSRRLQAPLRGHLAPANPAVRLAPVIPQASRALGNRAEHPAVAPPVAVAVMDQRQARPRAVVVLEARVAADH
jgi:hypothetical protein